MPRARVALVLLLLLGAAGNVLRGAGWIQSAGFILHPFSTPHVALATANVRSFAKLEPAAPAWRPLRVSMKARGTTEGTSLAQLTLSLDGEERPPIRLSGDWRAFSFVADRPPLKSGVLTLHLSVTGDGGAAAGGAAAASGAGAIELTEVTLSPVFAVWPFVRYAVTGALFGLIVWGVIFWRGPWETVFAAAPASSGTAVPARAAMIDWKAGLLAGLAIFLLFGVWALIRPPIQTPDEPHHFMRVTSILHRPWVAGADYLTLDFRFINPIVWDMPPLARIVFQPTAKLSRADVEWVKATGWHSRDEVGGRAPLHAAITSYPPLYYLGVLAVGQPIVALTQMTPYQAFYTFRLVSVLLTTVAWLAVYLLLRRMPELAPWAGLIVATIVLNPMASFMSSGVNPDALSLPLITLAVLACWRTLSTGEGAGMTFVSALLAMFTKPSGTQMAGALLVGAVWCAYRRQVTVRHAWHAGRAVTLAALLAYATFYAWSPTYFYPVPGHEGITLAQYARHVIDTIPEVWQSFWGVLGWLEYALPRPWYDALYLLALLCAAWRWREMRQHPEHPPRDVASGLVTYLAVYVAAFLVSAVAGGFVNLSVAGYMLQGRYFLPIAIGLAPLVMQESRWKRLALPAFVLLLNVLLMRETVLRYYGDWSLLWLSLPFV